MIINCSVVVSGEHYLKIATGYLGIVASCFVAIQITKTARNSFVTIGKYGMDIYILANAVQVAVRSVFLKLWTLTVFSVVFCLLCWACLFQSLFLSVSLENLRGQEKWYWEWTEKGVFMRIYIIHLGFHRIELVD